MSHWDGPAVAERLDASVHAVWRILRREGIYLQRRRSWCVSTDKEFAPKAADVVGLYLKPTIIRELSTYFSEHSHETCNVMYLSGDSSNSPCLNSIFRRYVNL